VVTFIERGSLGAQEDYSLGLNDEEILVVYGPSSGLLGSIKQARKPVFIHIRLWTCTVNPVGALEQISISQLRLGLRPTSGVGIPQPRNGFPAGISDEILMCHTTYRVRVADTFDGGRISCGLFPKFQVLQVDTGAQAKLGFGVNDTVTEFTLCPMGSGVGAFQAQSISHHYS
jgi:hypothetical protein